MRDRKKRAEQKRRYRKKHPDVIARQVARARERKLEWINSLKDYCNFCHVDDPDVLEWHHLDPSLKSKAVSQMAYAQRKAILREIEKCILLCCNCHRKLHRQLVRVQEGCEEAEDWLYDRGYPVAGHYPVILS